MAKLLSNTRIYGTGTVDTQLFVRGVQSVHSTASGALQVSGGIGVAGGGFFSGAVTATNFVGSVSGASASLAGGTAGQVPFQVSPGVTDFFGPGTAGQILVSAGTSAPVYTNTASIYVGNAVTATNVRGGAADQFVYQTAPGVTAFINTGSMYVGNAVTATNVRGGAADQFVYQTAPGITAFINTGSMYVNRATIADTVVGGTGFINTVQQTANAAHYLAFVDSNNASATAENVYTTSSLVVNPGTGNVGIGTVSPAAALHISSPGSAKLKISADTDNVTEADVAGIELSQDGVVTTANFGLDDNNHLVLGVNSTTAPNIYIGTRSDGTNFVSAADAKITVLNSGNVGVGVSPSYKLDVDGVVQGRQGLRTGLGYNSYISDRLQFAASTGVTHHQFKQVDTGGSNSRLDLRRFTGTGDGFDSGEMVTFLSNGNVGIGITAPISRLHISGDARITGITTVTNATSVHSTATGAFQVAGGIGIAGGGFFGGTVTATNFVGIFSGAATQVQTVQRTTNAAHFLTFVDSNNASAAGELVYTTSSFVVNPGTGNVGIGTTSPDHRLNINNSSLGTNLDDRRDILRLQTSSSNSDFLDFFKLRNAAGTDWTTAGWRIQQKIDATWMAWMQFNGSGNNAGISFGAGSSTTSPRSIGEHLRLTSSGNFGIGTTSPGFKLDVTGTASASADFRAPIFYDSNNTAYYVDPAGTTSALFAGNVGIGTTGPTSRLTITDGAATPYAAVEGIYLDIKRNASNGNNTTSRAGLRLANNSNGFQIYYGGDTDRLRFIDGGNTEVLSLRNGGNVGIGVTNPTVRLQVSGTGTTLFTNSLYHVVTSSGTAGQGILLGYHSGTGVGGLIAGDAVGGSINNLIFGGYNGSAWGELMRLRGNGRLGIGTTDPAYRLDVQGDSVRIGDATYNANLLFGNNQGTWGSGIRVFDNSDAEMRIWHMNGRGQIVLATGYNGNGSTTMPTDGLFIIGDTTASPALKVGVGYTAANMRGGAGKFAVNGNLGVGIANPTSKFQVNHNGLTTSAFYVDIGNPSGASTLFEHTGAATPVTFRLRKSGYSGAALNYGILYLNMNDSTVGNGAALYFTLNSSTGVEREYGGIGAVIGSNTNAAETGHLYFMTMDAGSGRSEKMRILSGGNVGIGTTGPSFRLDVSGTGRASSDFRAPIFYDSNDTNFYVDPASTTRLNEVSSMNLRSYTNINIRAASGNYAGFGFSKSTSGVTANDAGYLLIRGGSDSFAPYTNEGITLVSDANSLNLFARGSSLVSGGTATVRMGTGNTETFRLEGNYSISYYSSRAPIFYDSDNTAYYTDPASYNRLNRLVLDQARINSSRYPVGHYTPGETVFEIDTSWTNDQLQAYFNDANVTWVADSTAPGGYAIQIVGSRSVGGEYGSGFPYIPVDQDDVFYMEVWIKSVSGSNGHYMGSIDYNQDFTSLGGNPGSFGYWVMSNSFPGTSWTKYSGYITGFGNSTGQFKSGTKYFTPQALFNYSGGGTSYISGWKCIKVSQQGNRSIIGRSGSIVDNSTYALDIYHPTNYRQLRVRAASEPLIKFSGAYNSGNGAELWQTTGGLFRVNVNGSLTGLEIGPGPYTRVPGSLRSSRLEDDGGTFLIRSGSGSGTTRHLNLADSTADPSQVVSEGNGTGISWGQRGDNQPYYMIRMSYRNFGGATYTKLTHNWHTGLILGANAAYGGIRFYADAFPISESLLFMINGGSNYTYKYTWMYTNTTGIYSDSFGCHIYPNNGSTHTQWRIDGQKNGYGGIWDAYSAVAGFMYDGAGNGGVYREANGRWYWYYLVANNCMGIGSSATSSSYRLYINDNGFIANMYANAFYYASDRKLKENISTISGALDLLSKFRGVTYNRKDDEDKKLCMGVIAQEVEEVFPSLVNKTKDHNEEEYLSVNYGNFAGVFIEAIKEQTTIINSLKEEIALLKAKLGV